MQSPGRRKMERNVSVPDEFAFETRLVVLNFMGLMPASCPVRAAIDWPPSALEHRNSINGCHASSESEQIDVALRAVSSQDDLNVGGNGDHVTEPYTLIRKGTHLRLFTSCELHSVSDVRSSGADENGSTCVVNGCQTLQSLDLNVPDFWITPASPPEAFDLPVVGSDASRSLSMPGVHETAGKCLLVQSVSSDASASDEVMQKSLSGAVSKRSSVVSCRLSPHPEEAFLLVGRQCSWLSCQSGSTRSLTSSLRRNSYVDVRQVDVVSLVHAQTLPPVAVDLKEEISKGIENLEKSFAQSRTERPIPPVLLQCPPLLPNTTSTLISPESQVADMLRVIGDRVEDDYDVVLSDATDELLRLQMLGHLTYNALQETALHLLHQSSVGWTQVALVLLLSQRVSLTLLSQGDRSVGRLAEYTARFITDHIADFILSRGGWQSIAEIGVVETPLPISDDDPIFSAVDMDASIDQVSSSSDVDPLKMDSSDGGKETDEATSRTTPPVNANQPDSTFAAGLTSDDDVTRFTKAVERCAANDECCGTESKAGDGCQHSVIESAVTSEDGEFRVPLLVVGVCVFVIFGTWIVYRRIRKG